MVVDIYSMKIDLDDELFEIAYRKKKYYSHKENKVYEFKEDD